MAFEGIKERLTRRALVLGKIEPVFNVDSLPDPNIDAALVSDPDYSVDPTVLERNFVREDLSPLGTRIGRKIASLSFGIELRSNGLTNSGSVSDAAILGTFLRASGYSETGLTGVGTVSAIRNAVGNTNNPTFAVAGSNTAGNINKYTLSVVLGGVSGVAKMRVTGGQAGRDTTVLPLPSVSAQVFRLDGVTTTVTATVDQSDPLAVDITMAGAFQVGDIVRVKVNGFRFDHTVITADTDLAGIATAVAALIDPEPFIAAGTTTVVVNITYVGVGDGVVVTSASTALTLGDTGMTLTPTFSGSLVLGDSFEVTVFPTGIRYEPISDDFESITLHAFFDGLKHVITGAAGTFSLTATAGEFGTIEFTFTGQYVAPTDQNPPSSTQETTLPPIIELAQLVIDDFQPVVNAFTIEQNNTIVPRPDVSAEDGFKSVRITARDPQGGIDPEATLGIDLDFWDQMTESTEFELNIKFGKDAGNKIAISANKAQYTGITYGDRDGFRTYDAGIRFAREFGDDEIFFVFF